MTVGGIMKDQNFIVEVFTVKASEDIELGETVVNDGSGLIAATSSHLGPYFMALQAHTYASPDPEEGQSDHDIRALVVGVGDCQAKPAAALVKGRYVELSTTAGEVTIFDYSGPGNWYDVSGISLEAVATTGTDAKVLFGHMP